MASEFITRVTNGEYKIIFDTNNAEHFRIVEDACRAAIGHQKPNTVSVVRCKDCAYFVANNAEEGDWSGRCDRTHGLGAIDGWWFCADGERRATDDAD